MARMDSACTAWWRTARDPPMQPWVGPRIPPARDWPWGRRVHGHGAEAERQPGAGRPCPELALGLALNPALELALELAS